MLKDFVIGVAGASAIDVRRAGRLLEGSSVLTDIGPPDVVEGAGAETVDTFAVVGSDDNVGEGSSILKEEYGVCVAAFGLVVAG